MFSRRCGLLVFHQTIDRFVFPLMIDSLSRETKSYDHHNCPELIEPPFTLFLAYDAQAYRMSDAVDHKSPT
jgi:hypothetical protein